MELRTAVDDNSGWKSLDKNWWKISYTSVSWAYSSQTPSSRFWKTAKPPFYHEALVSPALKGANTCTSPGASSMNQSSDQTRAMALSHLLCGVQCAEEVVAPYENAVDFFKLEDDCGSDRKQKSCRRISEPVDDNDLARSKAQWERFEDDLLAPLVDDVASKPDFSLPALSTESSPFSSTSDFGPCANSTSVPSTPQFDGSEVVVDVKESPPLRNTPDHHLNVVRPLNAAASSFVPSFAHTFPKTESYPPPTHSPFLPNPPDSYFDFPTHPSWTQLPSNRGDQEFASKCASIEGPAPESNIIPSFLQQLSQPSMSSVTSPRRRANTSKTREIIDRLRLSSQARASNNLSPVPIPPDLSEHHTAPRTRATSGFRAVTPLAQCEDDDGWIDLSDHPFARTEDRVRETRNLFLSFTKRRSTSASPSPNQTLAGAGLESSLEGQDINFTRTLSPAPMTPPATTSSTASNVSASSFMNDGWIEGPAIAASLPVKTKTAPQKKSAWSTVNNEPARPRHRKRKSSKASTPNTSSGPIMSSFGIVPGQPMITGIHTPMPVPVPAPSFPYIAPSNAGPKSFFQPTLPVPPQMMAPMAYASYMHQLQLTQMHIGGTSG